MKIAIIGTGYVGLVTGTCFASVGHDVTCVDTDRTKVDALRRVPESRQLPIYERGLMDLVVSNMAAGRLRFTTKYEEAIPGADICFIAVGTPEAHNGDADLRYVRDAAKTIAEHMTGFTIVADKSTVPVGTAREVQEIIEAGARHDVEVISNPEFLKEGNAVKDFQKPDRVIIGLREKSRYASKVRAVAHKLYDSFVREADRHVLFMNRESAELTKYASNAMLATRVSFINEIANVCDCVGANVMDVSRGMGFDDRIGAKFLNAGIGYGGSCFPKDVRALEYAAKRVGYDLDIMRAVDEVNERQKRKLADLVLDRFGNDLSGKRFAVWGLSFKPGTDDMREAPSMVIIQNIVAAGGDVIVYDPEAMEEFEREVGRLIGDGIWSPDFLDAIHPAQDKWDALTDADALLMVTEWDTFRRPDWNRVAKSLRSRMVFDGRNIFHDASLPVGFEYYAIGLSATP